MVIERACFTITNTTKPFREATADNLKLVWTCKFLRINLVKPCHVCRHSGIISINSGASVK